MSLYTELKRRNVFRVAAAYLVLGWLFLQVASTVLTFIGAPGWVGKAIVALLVIGFPPTLAVAWVFEVGPQGGVQRDDGVEPHANNVHARRLDILTLVGVVIVVVMVFAEQLRVPPKPSTVPSPENGAKENGTGVIKEGPIASESTAVVATPLITPVPFSPALPGSIAVLPFANMSPDPENEFFADGIAEELLGILSRVQGLNVASRTSSFAFKGKNEPVRDIARTLNVAHVLEGSVRRQGERVRITAQLINAETDKHLWSDSYDRDLTDIFKVQEEIAQAISDALGRVLGVQGAQAQVKVEVEAPTSDLDAYALYLEGRQKFFQRGPELVKARSLLEEAVARDPDFAPAWAALAGTYYVSPDYVSLPDAEGLQLAERAAIRARDLDANLALAWAVLGQVASTRGNILEGERMLREALAREPTDPTARLWLGLLHIAVGYYEEAEADLGRLLQIDPLSGIAHGWYGTVKRYLGDRAGGDAHLERASDLGWASADRIRSRFALEDGDRERALLLRKMDLTRFTDATAASRQARNANLAALEDPAKRAAFHQAVLADSVGINSEGWAAELAALGMHEEAIAVELDPGLPHNRSFTRFLGHATTRGVWTQPAFLELAERDGLLAYWKEKGYPKGCKLVQSPQKRLDCTERWR